MGFCSFGMGCGCGGLHYDVYGRPFYAPIGNLDLEYPLKFLRVTTFTRNARPSPQERLDETGIDFPALDVDGDPVESRQSVLYSVAAWKADGDIVYVTTDPLLSATKYITAFSVDGAGGSALWSVKDDEIGFRADATRIVYHTSTGLDVIASADGSRTSYTQTDQPVANRDYMLAAVKVYYKTPSFGGSTGVITALSEVYFPPSTGFTNAFVSPGWSSVLAPGVFYSKNSPTWCCSTFLNATFDATIASTSDTPLGGSVIRTRRWDVEMAFRQTISAGEVALADGSMEVNPTAEIAEILPSDVKTISVTESFDPAVTSGWTEDEATRRALLSWGTGSSRPWKAVRQISYARDGAGNHAAAWREHTVSNSYRARVAIGGTIVYDHLYSTGALFPTTSARYLPTVHPIPGPSGGFIACVTGASGLSSGDWGRVGLYRYDGSGTLLWEVHATNSLETFWQVLNTSENWIYFQVGSLTTEGLEKDVIAPADDDEFLASAPYPDRWRTWRIRADGSQYVPLLSNTQVVPNVPAWDVVKNDASVRASNGLSYPDITRYVAL